MRLRNLVEVNPPTPEFARLDAADEITFVPLEAVWPGGRLDLNRLRPKADVDAGYTRFREGDVLVPKITPTFEAARSAVATNVPTTVGAGTTELHVLRPRVGTDPRFVCYVTQSRAFLSAGQASMIGVAGQKRVPDQFVRDFSVAPLDPAKQRAIADFLDAETARIDALISARDRQVALVAERLDAERIWDLLQRDGDRRRLRRLFAAVGGSWGGDPGSSEVDLPVIRAADFDYSELCVGGEPPMRSFTGSEVRTRELTSGDLVLEKSGGGENQPVGRVVRFLHPHRAVPSNFAARLRPYDRSDGPYLCHALAAMWASGVTKSVIKQTTGIQNLDVDAWMSLHIPWPQKAVRDELSTRLENKRAAVVRTQSVIRQSIELLHEHKQALITAAVTGQLELARDLAAEAS